MLAIDVYRHRMNDGFWGIETGRMYYCQLKKGDPVVFYIAGKEGGKFAGTAILASNHQVVPAEQARRLLHPPFLDTTEGFFLTAIDRWEPTVEVRPLLKNLKMIRDQNNWQLSFRGSIIPIKSEQDYFGIVNHREQKEIERLSDLRDPPLTCKSPSSKVNRKIRESAFRERVRKEYDLACVVCGKKRFTKSKKPEVDAAHIYPKKFDGNDAIENGIALCKLHHWTFENGLFSIKDDYSIVVEKRIRTSAEYEEIACFENSKIRLPKNVEYAPHPKFLREHRKIHGFE